MGDLVRDHVIHHVARREDQAPGEGEHAVCRAAAPAALGVAQDDALDALADLLGLGPGARLDLAARLELQPIRDAARDVVLVPGDVDLLVLAPHHAARIGAVADAMLDAEEWDDVAMGERYGLGQLVEAFLDPI